MAEKVDQMDPNEKIVEIPIERLRVFENHPLPYHDNQIVRSG